MKIEKLKNPTINQNGYHKNTFTKERIGTLFTYPIDYTPDDCLACDGYLLKINDYEDLHKILGSKFNKADDPIDSFRIPDYNITGKFLQPGENVGSLVDAGLPAITHTHTATTSSAGGHTHTRGTMDITGTMPDWIANTGYSGAFYQGTTSTHGCPNAALSHQMTTATLFKASKNWTGSTSSSGAHTHTLTTENNSTTNKLYGASNTVQPSSQIVHICIKYK